MSGKGMDFSEIIGFLIAVAALIYMFIKRAQDARRRSENKEEDEEHGHEDRLKDFLKSLEIDMDESEDFRPPPKVSKPKPVPVYREEPRIIEKKKPLHEDFKFRSDLEDFQMKTNIEERKLKVNIKNRYEANYGDHLVRPEFRGEKMPHLIGYKKASRIKNLIRDLPSKKDLILLHEILEKPKGFK